MAKRITADDIRRRLSYGLRLDQLTRPERRQLNRLMGAKQLRQVAKDEVINGDDADRLARYLNQLSVRKAAPGSGEAGQIAFAQQVLAKLEAAATRQRADPELAYAVERLRYDLREGFNLELLTPEDWQALERLGVNFNTIYLHAGEGDPSALDSKDAKEMSAFLMTQSKPAAGGDPKAAQQRADDIYAVLRGAVAREAARPDTDFSLAGIRKDFVFGLKLDQMAESEQQRLQGDFGVDFQDLVDMAKDGFLDPRDAKALHDYLHAQIDKRVGDGMAIEQAVKEVNALYDVLTDAITTQIDARRAFEFEWMDGVKHAGTPVGEVSALDDDRIDVGERREIIVAEVERHEAVIAARKEVTEWRANLRKARAGQLTSLSLSVSLNNSKLEAKAEYSILLLGDVQQETAIRIAAGMTEAAVHQLDAVRASIAADIANRFTAVDAVHARLLAARQVQAEAHRISEFVQVHHRRTFYTKTVKRAELVALNADGDVRDLKMELWAAKRHLRRGINNVVATGDDLKIVPRSLGPGMEIPEPISIESDLLKRMVFESPRLSAMIAILDVEGFRVQEIRNNQKLWNSLRLSGAVSISAPGIITNPTDALLSTAESFVTSLFVEIKRTIDPRMDAAERDAAIARLNSVKADFGRDFQKALEEVEYLIDQDRVQASIQTARVAEIRGDQAYMDLLTAEPAPPLARPPATDNRAINRLFMDRLEALQSKATNYHELAKATVERGRFRNALDERFNVPKPSPSTASVDGRKSPGAESAPDALEAVSNFAPPPRGNWIQQLIDWLAKTFGFASRDDDIRDHAWTVYSSYLRHSEREQLAEFLDSDEFRDNRHEYVARLARALRTQTDRYPETGEGALADADALLRGYQRAALLSPPPAEGTDLGAAEVTALDGAVGGFAPVEHRSVIEHAWDSVRHAFDHDVDARRHDVRVVDSANAAWKKLEPQVRQQLATMASNPDSYRQSQFVAHIARRLRESGRDMPLAETLEDAQKVWAVWTGLARSPATSATPVPEPGPTAPAPPEPRYSGRGPGRQIAYAREPTAEAFDASNASIGLGLYEPIVNGAQRLLFNGGLFEGLVPRAATEESVADDFYGERTEIAVRRWQLLSGEEATGWLDKRQLDLLAADERRPTTYSAAPVRNEVETGKVALLRGHRGEWIKDVQRQLLRAGAYEGLLAKGTSIQNIADGYFGTATEAAIVAWRRKTGHDPEAGGQLRGKDLRLLAAGASRSAVNVRPAKVGEEPGLLPRPRGTGEEPVQRGRPRVTGEEPVTAEDWTPPTAESATRKFADLIAMYNSENETWFEWMWNGIGKEDILDQYRATLAEIRALSPEEFEKFRRAIINADAIDKLSHIRKRGLPPTTGGDTILRAIAERTRSGEEAASIVIAWAQHAKLFNRLGIPSPGYLSEAEDFGRMFLQNTNDVNERRIFALRLSQEIEFGGLLKTRKGQVDTYNPDPAGVLVAMTVVGTTNPTDRAAILKGIKPKYMDRIVGAALNYDRSFQVDHDEDHDPGSQQRPHIIKDPGTANTSLMTDFLSAVESLPPSGGEVSPWVAAIRKALKRRLEGPSLLVAILSPNDPNRRLIARDQRKLFPLELLTLIENDSYATPEQRKAQVYKHLEDLRGLVDGPSANEGDPQAIENTTALLSYAVSQLKTEEAVQMMNEIEADRRWGLDRFVRLIGQSPSGSRLLARIVDDTQDVDPALRILRSVNKQVDDGAISPEAAVIVGRALLRMNALQRSGEVKLSLIRELSKDLRTQLTDSDDNVVFDPRGLLIAEAFGSMRDSGEVERAMNMLLGLQEGAALTVVENGRRVLTEDGLRALRARFGARRGAHALAKLAAVGRHAMTPRGFFNERAYSVWKGIGAYNPTWDSTRPQNDVTPFMKMADAVHRYASPEHKAIFVTAGATAIRDGLANHRGLALWEAGMRDDVARVNNKLIEMQDGEGVTARVWRAKTWADQGGEGGSLNRLFSLSAKQYADLYQYIQTGNSDHDPFTGRHGKFRSHYERLTRGDDRQRPRYLLVGEQGGVLGRETFSAHSVQGTEALENFGRFMGESRSAVLMARKDMDESFDNSRIRDVTLNSATRELWSLMGVFTDLVAGGNKYLKNLGKAIEVGVKIRYHIMGGLLAAWNYDVQARSRAKFGEYRFNLWDATAGLGFAEAHVVTDEQEVLNGRFQSAMSLAERYAGDFEARGYSAGYQGHNVTGTADYRKGQGRAPRPPGLFRNYEEDGSRILPTTGKVLRIEGTDTADNIQVQKGRDGGLVVRVTGVGGPEDSFVRTLTQQQLDEGYRLMIDAKGGDDRIAIDDDVQEGVIVFAGAGDDRVFGGGGADYIEGNEGDDLILGRGGRDVIYGLDGRDLILGGADADYMDGGADDDIVLGQSGDDKLFGGRGRDTMFGQDGDDVLAGGLGKDVSVGGEGADVHHHQPEDTVGVDDGDERRQFEIDPDWRPPQNIGIRGDDRFRARVTSDFHGAMGALEGSSGALEDLRRSRHEVIIEETDERNETEFDDVVGAYVQDDGKTPSYGSGATIRYNRTRMRLDQDRSWSERPPVVGLFHEAAGHAVPAGQGVVPLDDSAEPHDGTPNRERAAIGLPLTGRAAGTEHRHQRNEGTLRRELKIDDREDW